MRASDKVSETWITTPKRVYSSAVTRDACLVHIYPTGPAMGHRYALGDKPLMVGRGDDCDLRIPDHSVSRRHAKIEPSPDGYIVTDLGSTNGTFVNDTQVTADGEVPVANGDKLRVGPLEFTVRIDIPKPTASDPTPLPEALKAVDAGAKATPAAQPPVKPKPQPIPKAASSGGDDDAAALLLGMTDDDPSPGPDAVPTGSTIMDVPVGALAGTPPAADAKKGAVPTKEDTSNAASEILRKYMRRPR